MFPLALAEVLAALISAGGAFLIGSYGKSITSRLNVGAIFVRKVVFPGGKVEFLDARVSEGGKSSFDVYISYEKLVQRSLAKITKMEISIQYGSNDPDFLFEIEHKRLAVEVKLSFDHVSPKKINSLFVDKGAERLLLVSPSEPSEDTRRRYTEEFGAHVVHFVSGQDSESLKPALEAAIASA